MERKMKTEALPQTDSIQELAEFWDKHDLTDFEDFGTLVGVASDLLLSHTEPAKRVTRCPQDEHIS